MKLLRAYRSTGTWHIRAILLKFAAVSALFSLASTAQAISFTPNGICTDAGFPKNHEFRQTCVDRVFSERRSRAWREQAPAALMGIMAGVAATGGTAFGYVTVPGQTNLRRVDLEGQAFVVHVPNDTVATVVSSQQYKNIPKAEIDLWVRAAAQGSGCLITRYVRDFDALYVWTDCSKSAPAATTIQINTQQPSIVDELAKLASMREKGLLSAEEFSAAKATLLDQQKN